MDQLIIHKIVGTIKGFTSVSGNIRNPGTDVWDNAKAAESDHFYIFLEGLWKGTLHQKDF